jgi:hypothetical protein
MSYWGSHAEESDFAFGAVGVAILRIKKKMLEDIEVVKEKSYPEQSILSSLVCLRLLGERFPNSLSVHFCKSDLEKVRTAFDAWYQQVESQIPKKYRVSLLETAKIEFQLFEERIFNKPLV